MSAVPGLPRKLQSPASQDTLKKLGYPIDNAQVHEVCKTLWHNGLKAGRQDGFIGLLYLKTCELFIAPCFGVDDAAIKKVIKAAVLEAVAKGEFPDDTDVMSSSTANAVVTKTIEKKGAVEAAYGKGNVCFAMLVPADYASGNFDGKSHQSVYRWLQYHPTIKGEAYEFKDFLGFAIQKDTKGYYIRFASSLNQGRGQVVSGNQTFESRTDPKKGDGKEERDLPKQWAELLEKILARDLKLGLLRGNGKYERMTSRGEAKTSKRSRFEANPTLHRVQSGSTVTTNTLVV